MQERVKDIRRVVRNVSESESNEVSLHTDLAHISFESRDALRNKREYVIKRKYSANTNLIAVLRNNITHIFALRKVLCGINSYLQHLVRVNKFSTWCK